tara:strand:- start:108 stop:884 length:777 start_codon:yes stop_codon:yes gene_type:complete
MSDWNPRNEWNNLLIETRIRSQEEHLNELFGFGKKKSQGKKKVDVNKDIGKTDQRTVETWEDLRNLISVVTSRDQAEKLAKKSGEAAASVVKNIAYQIPVIGNIWTLVGTAKDSLSLLNNIMKLPEDQVEKNPMLDTLQLDDEYVEIVDNDMALEFLKFFSGYIETKTGKIPDTIPLEADWNGDGNKTKEEVPTTINSLFQKWIQDHGTGGEATVVGAGSDKTFTDIPYPEDDSLEDKAKAAGKAGLGGVKSFLLNMF